AQGFDVFEALDVGQSEFRRLVVDFGDRLASAPGNAVGLFYFAGHGFQMGNENLLIPVDATIRNEHDLDVESISARHLLDTLESVGNSLNIVIIDASRDDPFSDIRTTCRGMTAMSAPTGTLIAYATAPGDVALDGDASGNSPYAKALATMIAMPGIPVEQMFREVRNAVLAATNGLQTPWENSSLTGGDYFLVATQPNGDAIAPTEKTR
ncbi:MAG: caspase family protein, partial [Alphaproteobacteria bacterium]|nr:caspase family protein [Alphaproteobacteria bacterium]